MKEKTKAAQKHLMGLKGISKTMAEREIDPIFNS